MSVAPSLGAKSETVTGGGVGTETAILLVTCSAGGVFARRRGWCASD